MRIAFNWNADLNPQIYVIFDAWRLTQIFIWFGNAQQYKRIEWLESARSILSNETNCLRIMNGLDVDLDTTEGHDIMRRYAEDAVAEGFEGIMIKSMDAPYECKRSDFWMK